MKSAPIRKKSNGLQRPSRVGLLLLWLALAVTGCRGLLPGTAPPAAKEETPTLRPAEPSPSLSPPATATAAPMMAPTTTATAVATVLPEETPTAAPTTAGEQVLPAPLYYLREGQIMRLEIDGVTVTQITNEASPVTDFDVSPDGDRLAYVSDNDLIEADADGGNRVIKVGGEVYGEDDTAARITQEISHPRFSPDGGRLAFGLNGVNLMPAGEGADDYQVIQASDPYPDAGDLPDDEPIRFFWPSAWSPDGGRLLLEFAYWPEAGGLAIKDLNGGGLVDVTNPDSIVVGDWAWGPNGQAAFLASNALVYGAPGLVRVDAATGESTTLVKGLPNGEASADKPIRLFRAPHVTAGGDLAFFVRFADSMEDAGAEGYRMYRSATDGSGMAPLRDDAFSLGTALWAEDGSGAVVVEAGHNERYPPAGPMLWAPAGAGPVVELAADGGRPQWGRAVAQTTGRIPPSEELASLATEFLATLGLQEQDGIREAHVVRLDTADGPQWLAHTIGLRSFEPLQRHTIAIYRYNSGKWVEQARLAFAEGGEPGTPPGPDYVGENGVRQVSIETAMTWMAVDGGVGAHGGTFHLLRYDGESITVALGHGNGFPGVGRVEDLNEDGKEEVILDNSEAYVFCYACGVRLINYDVWRWDGSALAPLTLTPLPETDPAASLNNRAVALAQAGLWKQAQTLIKQVEEAPPKEEAVAWNAALINLTADGRKRAVEPFPLLGHVFYGDYAAAVNAIRAYEPSQIFSRESPLVMGTPAEGWVEQLAAYLQRASERALDAPELGDEHRAAATFLRGWAAYLTEPAGAGALSNVERAAELAPDDRLYTESSAYLRQ
ncbi:MAG: hypothetical protein R3248_04865 [Candidatus Promineifilaceae bacterium]|nr:hypothetical protein [Candidatus Promineifilaceae bacterium]